VPHKVELSLYKQQNGSALQIVGLAVGVSVLFPRSFAAAPVSHPVANMLTRNFIAPCRVEELREEDLGRWYDFLTWLRFSDFAFWKVPFDIRL